MPQGIFSGSGECKLVSVEFDWIIILGTLISLTPAREKGREIQHRKFITNLRGFRNRHDP